jgi:hypothetical protein
MTAKTDNTPQKKSLSIHLVAGGAAGFMEAMICHPLDTIKVRMQLRAGAPGRAQLKKVSYNSNNNNNDSSTMSLLFSCNRTNNDNANNATASS